MRSRARTTSSLLTAWLCAAIGCSYRPLKNGDAGTPPIDALVSAYYAPCYPGTLTGGIRIALVSPWADSVEFPLAAYTAVDAWIGDDVEPASQWTTTAIDGTCRLLERPTCTPACAQPQLCARGNRCAVGPTGKNVGTISFHGLGLPLELPAVQSAPGSYAQEIDDPFPLAAPDASITAKTSGGDYPPFSLEARGVEALEFDGANLSADPGRTLDFTWTPPPRPAAAHIIATLVLQPSVGAPIIECMFPDTGSASIPRSLLDPLLALGTNDTPRLYLARRTVTSTITASGCVELQITARVGRNVRL